MKIKLFNNDDIALVTEMTEDQREFVEGQYPVLYNNDGLYIPGDCVINLLKNFDSEVISAPAVSRTLS